MPQAKQYRDYYTAAEVKQKLGITDGMLYNYVRYGHLERIIPPGRKQGVYKREEVDKFALEMKAFLGSRTETKRFTFTRVAKNDVTDNVEITRAAFGPGTGITVEKRTTWIEKNPDVSYQLCLDGAVIGCATILPLRLEHIEQILRDEVNSEDTSPEDIEDYRPGKVYHLYIMGVCVSPSLSKQEKRWYGAKLVRGIIDAIIYLGRRDIEIETITARSMTVDGVRLMRHLGFPQIPSTTKNVNFRIDMKKADRIEIVQQYKNAVEEVRRGKLSQIKNK